MLYDWCILNGEKSYFIKEQEPFFEKKLSNGLYVVGHAFKCLR